MTCNSRIDINYRVYDEKKTLSNATKGKSDQIGSCQFSSLIYGNITSYKNSDVAIDREFITIATG